MFLLVVGGHICAPQSDTNVESPYMQGFINLGKLFFQDISHTKYPTDLFLGDSFCITIFFHFPYFEINLFLMA